LIKGYRRPGLIIDPGAARGLIGTDSLKMLIDMALRPQRMHKYVRWKSSNDVFSGISAMAEKSLGKVTIPIGLAGLTNATYTADVVGGQASQCPGLVPLHTLKQLGAIIMCGYFQNGDGLLGLRSPDGTITSHRIYLTDSGHYLLPIDAFHKKKNTELDSLTSHEMDAMNKTQRKSPWKPGNHQTALLSGIYISDVDPNQDFRQVPDMTVNCSASTTTTSRTTKANTTNLGVPSTRLVGQETRCFPRT